MNIVYFFKDIVIAEEGPFPVILLFHQFIPDNVQIELQGLSGFRKILIAFLQFITRFRIQILPVSLYQGAILRIGFLTAVQVHHCLHQLNMQLIIHLINPDSSFTDIADLVISFVFLQQLQIPVDRIEIFIVQPV